MILDALLTQCLREPEERQRMRRDVKLYDTISMIYLKIAERKSRLASAFGGQRSIQRSYGCR